MLEGKSTERHRRAALERPGVHPAAGLRFAVAFLFVAVLVAAAPAGAGASGPQVLVKFKESLTQCAHCLLQHGQTFSGALTDGSHDLDYINAQMGVSAGAEVFFPRHEMTTVDAKQAFQARIDAVKALYPKRTARIPAQAGPPDLDLVNVYRFDLGGGTNPVEACAQYKADPHVEWCQPNDVVHASAYFVPNDPYYASSGSFGQSYADLWGVKQMHMYRPWTTTLGDDVVVAVIDTGLDLFHPDIYANIARNLVSGEEIIVAEGEFSPIDGVFGCPAIDGNTIAYTRLLGNSTYPLYYDMTTRSSTRMTFDAQTIAIDMQVSGNRLVWQDSREGIANQIWMWVR